jgi:hypothetical protein
LFNYQYQISIKIQRALRSVTVEKQSEYDDDIARDSNGSAKVALIGIERSIAAWKMLLNSFPDLEKQIIDLIIFLKSISE